MYINQKEIVKIAEKGLKLVFFPELSILIKNLREIY